MRIDYLRRALDIVARHKPNEDVGVWDDVFLLCDADVPFSDEEREELISLGFTMSGDSWVSES